MAARLNAIPQCAIVKIFVTLTNEPTYVPTSKTSRTQSLSRPIDCVVHHTVKTETMVALGVRTLRPSELWRRVKCHLSGSGDCKSRLVALFDVHGPFDALLTID